MSCTGNGRCMKQCTYLYVPVWISDMNILQKDHTSFVKSNVNIIVSQLIV